MSFEVLRPQVERDRERWISLIESLEPAQRDIHFHPDYIGIYEQTYPETGHLAVWTGNQGTIFQPFICRDIPRCDRTDLFSVYGYGGALALGSPSASDISNFRASLSAFADSLGAVSEFCLLSPFFYDLQKQYLEADQKCELRKNVVVADLRTSLPKIWSRIEERQRKAALAARKAGLEVWMSDLSDRDLDAYHDMYIRTMHDVGARTFWHFPDRYFHNCRDCLGEENVTLLHAKRGGRTLAAFFHVHMYDTVYYHFSCSEPDAKKTNAATLLMLDSLLWAKGAGFKMFHMGGGRTDGADTLFNFKYSFSGQTLPLYSTERIFDPGTYDALTNATKHLEIERLGAAIDSNFFPRYRLQS